MTQIAEWMINGNQIIVTLPTSGGSGGGGCNNATHGTRLSGASAGAPFIVTYSKLQNGFNGRNGTSTQGRSGGSATGSGRV